VGRFRRKPLRSDATGTGERFNFTQDVVESLASGDGGIVAFLAVDSLGVIERRTLQELADDAARWSALLAAYGVQSGDRVLVHLSHGMAWPAVLLGAVKAGMTAVSCPETASAEDLELAASAVRLVVTDRAHTSATLATDTVIADDVVSELRALSGFQPTHATSTSDLAILVHDGETPTAITHGSTSSLGNEAKDQLDVRSGDTIWCTAPAGSSASIRRFLGALACSATSVLHDGPLPYGEQVELVERLGVNVLFAEPEELGQIVKLAPGHESLASLRLVVSEGGALDSDVAIAFSRTYGVETRDGGSRRAGGGLPTALPDAVPEPPPMAAPTSHTRPTGESITTADQTSATVDAEEARWLPAGRTKQDERRRMTEEKAAADADSRARKIRRKAAREAERQRKTDEQEARRLAVTRAEEEESRRKAEENAAAKAAREADPQPGADDVEPRKSEVELRKEAIGRDRKAEEAAPPLDTTERGGDAADEPEPQPESLIVQRLQAYGQSSLPSKAKPPAE
jgi:hypothetical protein